MQMLTIERTQPSKSGKTLSVLSNDTWYSTKCWDLQHCTGQTIMAKTSTSQYNGSNIHWIDDYAMPGGDGAQAMQAASQAPAQAPGQPIAQPAQPDDRSASIIAQALVKACQPGTIASAVDAYWFALKAIKAGPPVEQPQAQPVSHPGETNDDIPF